MKPTHVFVEFSESPFLKTTVYPFHEFETIASNISDDTECYCCKTKVMVMFDNGESYRCRLDLDDMVSGFESHIKNCLNTYLERMRRMADGEIIAKPVLEDYKKLLPVWQRMVFETVKDMEEEQDMENLAHYKQCFYLSSHKLNIAEFIMTIRYDEERIYKLLDELRFQAENNADEVKRLEKRLGKGLLLKRLISNGRYDREGVTDDCRVYFRGDNQALYCVQPSHEKGLELMLCSKEGEPSHSIKSKYFVFDGTLIDAYRLAEYRGRDAIYQFFEALQ